MSNEKKVKKPLLDGIQADLDGFTEAAAIKTITEGVRRGETKFFRPIGAVYAKVPNPNKKKINLDTGKVEMGTTTINIRRKDKVFQNIVEQRVWMYFCQRTGWNNALIAKYPALTLLLRDLCIERHFLFQTNQMLWEYNEKVLDRFNKLAAAGQHVLTVLLSSEQIVQDPKNVQALDLLNEALKKIEPPGSQKLKKSDIKRLKSARKFEAEFRLKSNYGKKVYFDDPEGI